MDVFSLTETEFSRQLTNGENEILLHSQQGLRSSDQREQLVDAI